MSVAAEEKLPDTWEQSVVQASQSKKEARYSQHFQEYRQIMKKVIGECEEGHPNFQLDNITYNPNNFNKLSFKVTEQFNNFEIVVLDVELGSFVTRLKILNSANLSPLVGVQCSGQGNFGKIFLVDYCGQVLTVKSISLYPHMNLVERRATLRNVIKEYSMTMIARSLGVAPALPRPSGFDIIVYSNSIEFVMETCEHLTKFQKEDQTILLKNLRNLHRFKIMHMDINPNNVMFSRSMQKIVFIDFGLSEIIKEDCGFETLTFYRGTPNYVCKQMLKLFSIDCDGGFVDLYYNDAVSLQTTSSRLSEKEALSQNQFAIRYHEKHGLCNGPSDPNQKQQKYENECLLMHFKFICFFFPTNAPEIFDKAKATLLKHHPKEMLKLLTSLLPAPMVQNMVIASKAELFYLDEYNILIQKVIFFKQSVSIDKLSPSKTDSDFKEFYQQQEEPELPNQSEKQHKLEVFIINLQKREYFDSCIDKSQYYDRMFSCLRFDEPNLDVGVKYQIASAFLGFIEQQHMGSEQNPLPVLRKVFKYLLTYCLRESPSTWRIKNRLDLLFHSLLTDTDILEELDFLTQTIQDCIIFMDVFSLFCQFTKLDNFLQKKCFFEDHTVAMITINKTKEVFTVIARTLSNLFPQLVNEERLIGRLVLKIIAIRQKTAIFQQNLQKEIVPLTDDMIKYELTLILHTTEFKSISCNYHIYIFLQKLNKQQFWRSPYFQQRRFMEKMFWNWLVASLLSLGDIQALRKEIRTTQNYDAIYEQLVFDYTYNSNKVIQLSVKQPSLYEALAAKMITACFVDKRFTIFSELDSFWNTDGIQVDILSSLLVTFDKEYGKYCCEGGFLIRRQGEKDKYHILQMTEQTWGQHRHIVNAMSKRRLIMNNIQYTLIKQTIARQYWAFMQRHARGQDLSLEEWSQLKKLFYTYLNIQSITCVLEYPHLKWLLQQLQQFDMPILHESCLDDIFNLKVSCHHLKNFYKIKTQALAVWIMRYVSLKGLTKYYYFYRTVLNQNDFIGQIFYTLFQHHQLQQLFIFLKKLILILGEEPRKINVHRFRVNLINFVSISQQLPIFLLNFVKEVFYPITWQNRYCLILYILSLSYNPQNQVARKTLITIAKHLHWQDFYMKKYILPYYLEVIEKNPELGIKLSPRKRRYFIFMWGFNYFCYRNISAPINHKNYLDFSRLKNKEGHLCRRRLRDKMYKKVHLYLLKQPNE